MVKNEREDCMDILSALRNILFPPACQNCRQASQGRELCASCMELYRAETEECCPRCGKRASVCACGTEFTHHTGTTIGGYSYLALTFYKSQQNYGITDRITERMLYRLKSNGTYAQFFAEELCQAVETLFRVSGEDLSGWCITFLPRSTGKRLSSGFDQSEEVARMMAKRLKIPMSVLFVRDHGQEQKKLNREQRLANAENSLVMKKKLKAGGKYLLLDDIITSGATMETAARHLWFNGAAAVFPIAIARSMPKEQMKDEPEFTYTYKGESV